MTLKRSIPAAVFALTTVPALAHSGAGASASFATGLLHPMSGLDHLLAMGTVGLLAVLLGGRALWAIPASFLTMMLVGGIIALAQAGLPAIEFGIAASVVVLGTLVALGKPRTTGAAIGLVGLFAMFHGYAHIAEMPETGATANYCLGFMLGGAVLQSAGIALGIATVGHPHVIRATGAAVAVAGLVFAFA